MCSQSINVVRRLCHAYRLHHCMSPVALARVMTVDSADICAYGNSKLFMARVATTTGDGEGVKRERRRSSRHTWGHRAMRCKDERCKPWGCTGLLPSIHPVITDLAFFDCPNIFATSSSFLSSPTALLTCSTLSSLSPISKLFAQISLYSKVINYS